MAKSANPIQVILDLIPPILKNRYFLVLAFFFAWMIFFDRYDLISQWRLQQSLDKLQVDKVFYEEKIEEAKADKKDIEQNVEKYAREKYFMHRDDEDVFIIMPREEIEEH